MGGSTFKLTWLTIAALLAVGHALPLSSPCTEEEMTQPIKDFHKLVEEMQEPDADIEAIDKKINDEMNKIPDHIMSINSICGDEKTEALERLSKLVTRVLIAEDIVTAIDNGELETAKEKFENIHCEHAIQYIIRKYGTDADKIEKIIDVIKKMDDLKLINKMNEAIIYILNESNSEVLKDLIPLMKEQIQACEESAAPDDILIAKLNLKEVAKRNIPHCYKGVKALNEVDSEMADQAIYEATFQLFTDSLHSPAWKVATKTPCVHIEAHALEAIFDKVKVLEKTNGMAAAKVFILAKRLIENEEIKESPKSMEILNNIIENTSILAKNVANGYSCQDFEEMRHYFTDENKHEEHNEYFIFYNPEQPEKLSNGKFVEKPDGDMLFITIDNTYGDKKVRYSILMENNDYPELQTKGTIVSKKILGKESATREEICGMNPKPEADICVPFSDFLTWDMETGIKNTKAMYDNFIEHIKVCTQA